MRHHEDTHFIVEGEWYYCIENKNLSRHKSYLRKGYAAIMLECHSASICRVPGLGSVQAVV